MCCQLEENAVAHRMGFNYFSTILITKCLKVLVFLLDKLGFQWNIFNEYFQVHDVNYSIDKQRA